MRAGRIVAALMLIWGGAAHAQSPTQGPLATPDIGPAQPNPAKPKAHRKPTKTARRAVPKDGGGFDPGAHAGASPAPPPPGTPLPADPVDFGMKWNGSNDTASQTRVQNYNGGAQGTGAEVGMKLHF